MPTNIVYPEVSKEDVLEAVQEFYTHLWVSLSEDPWSDEEGFREFGLRVAEIKISQVQHMMQADLATYREAVAKKKASQ